MQRSFQDIVKDAADLARRTNLQVLAFLAGLILAWFTGIEPQFAKIASSINSLSDIAIAEDYSNRIKHITSRRQMAYGEVLENIRRYEARCVENRYSEECLKAQRIIRIARGTPLRAAEIFSEQDTSEKNRNKQIGVIRSELAKEIDFNLGYGLKLPFSFMWAPAIWLLLLSILLFRIIWQRTKFWALLAAALKTLPRVDRKMADRQLSDMPLWLAPAPRGVREGVRKAQLARIVGWPAGRTANLLFVGLFLITLIAMVRVAWIGLVVTGIGARNSLSSSQDVEYLTAVAFALALVLLVLLAVPWWTSATSIHPTYSRQDRRLLLGAGLGVATLLVVQSATSAAFALKWWSARRHARARATRYRPRLPRVSTIEGPILRPGWYRHKRSGVIHYIWSDNRVRRARGLRARNLERLDVRLSVMPADISNIEPWIRTRDFPLVIEANADRLFQQRRFAEAIKLLLLASPYRWTLAGPSAALPWMDRAARLSASHAVPAMLGRLIGIARQLEPAQPNGGPSVLADRIGLWEVWLSRLGPAGADR